MAYIADTHRAEKNELLHIPPYAPEMNPIEQIWEELREKGFRNCLEMKCFKPCPKWLTDYARSFII